jgi:hypothetical protein
MMARRSPHGPSKTNSKPRRTRRWKAPANIHDTASPFAIDDEICKAPLQSRWQLADAIAFGRSTLAVAIEEGRKHESHRPGEILASWKRTALLAERSYRTLSQLIDYIGRRGVPLSDARQPTTLVKKSPALSGGIWVRFVQPSREDTEREVEALRKASDMLQQLAARAQRRSYGLARARKNEGDPGKRAFVHALAVSWISLTGRKPGRNFYATRNPFLRFVKAAWADAGFCDHENFSRALESTLTGLAYNEYWSWSELGRETFKRFARRGPIGWSDAFQTPSEDS